jgi:AcrR family transcriptional regulator
VTQTATTTQGRPRDAGLSARIHAATVEILAEHGYRRHTVDRIAAAARCGKAAIYRRYADKAEATVDAMVQYLEVGPVPDTGGVIEDLVVHARQNRENQAIRNDARIGPALARTVFEPEIFPALWKITFKQRHDNGLSIVSRAIERGELPPNADGDMILDTIAGLTLFRHTLKGVPVTDADNRELITRLVTNPPLVDAPRDSPE